MSDSKKDARELFVVGDTFHKARLRGAFKKFIEGVEEIDGSKTAGIREPLREEFEDYMRGKVENWDDVRQKFLTDRELEDELWDFHKKDDEYRDMFFDKYVTDGDYHPSGIQDIDNICEYVDGDDTPFGYDGSPGTIVYDKESVKETMYYCAVFSKTISSTESKPSAEAFTRYWADEWISAQFGASSWVDGWQGAASISYDGGYDVADVKCPPMAKELFQESDEFRTLVKNKWEQIEDSDGERKDKWSKWEPDEDFAPKDNNGKQQQQESQDGEEKGESNRGQVGIGDYENGNKTKSEVANGSTSGTEKEEEKKPENLSDWANQSGSVEESSAGSEKIEKLREENSPDMERVSGDASPDDAVTITGDDVIGEQFSRNLDSVMPYTGGKTKLADWIIDSMPEHQTYVEVFGGSAAVLLNKPRSSVEVYNDINNDLVHFFRTLRDRREELEDYCQHMVYSRKWYNDIADEFYEGVKCENDIKRAARFFYLMNSTFGGKISSRGWAKPTGNPRARSYRSNLESLEKFADRMYDVAVECLDYKELFNTYDDEDTLFYLDPPYKGTEDTYKDSSGFSHDRLADEILQLDGEWMLSYDHMPEWSDKEGIHVERRRENFNVNAGGRETWEYLVMSTEESGFFQAQESLEVFG